MKKETTSQKVMKKFHGEDVTPYYRQKAAELALTQINLDVKDPVVRAERRFAAYVSLLASM